jgi:NAD(P)-dependent dehydrogenase (short-subunit alcohol dehydrogenase family)
MTQQTGPDDHVVVVTGGARGIGAAVVEKFRSAGARVVCLVRSEPEQPQPGVRYVHADISIERDVEAAFADVDRVEGRVDVLVNNAAIQRLGPIGSVSTEDWDAVLATNLTGVFMTCSQAIRRMASSGRGGAIVNIASTAAFVALPGRGPYSAAKAGMLGLTRAIAVEGAAAGIRANAVAPGFTRSDFIQSRVDDGSLTLDWMLERVPMGRLAEPREIAEVVAAVASPAFSFVTGQTILVDGGWSIQGISNAPDTLRTTA